MSFKRFALALALAATALVFSQTTAPARQSTATAPPSPSGSAASTETAPPIPSPVPAADDPKVHKLAVQQFLAWQQGQIDRSQYADQINQELTDDVISRGSATLANMGALQNTTFRGISHSKQGDLYVYHMTCDRGAVDMDLGLDPKGLITAIFFE